ncbi:hypothetical protein L3Q67_01090 [Saccharothrix sp. AJ9571]|nr:hypothetical protein L3Q67_01090 [Saccharothrix sp. AJ9571]
MSASAVRFTTDQPSAQDITDALQAAMAHPEQFVERQFVEAAGRYESGQQWQARAAYAVVGPLLEQLHVLLAAACRPSGGTLPAAGGPDNDLVGFVTSPGHAAVPGDLGRRLNESIPADLMDRLHRELEELPAAGAEPDTEPRPDEAHQLLAAYGESSHPLAPYLTRSAAASALFAFASELADACDANENVPPDYVRALFARHLG